MPRNCIQRSVVPVAFQFLNLICALRTEARAPRPIFLICQLVGPNKILPATCPMRAWLPGAMAERVTACVCRGRLSSQTPWQKHLLKQLAPNMCTQAHRCISMESSNQQLKLVGWATPATSAVKCSTPRLLIGTSSMAPRAPVKREQQHRGAPRERERPKQVGSVPSKASWCLRRQKHQDPAP
jgi:hypothetical protein